MADKPMSFRLTPRQTEAIRDSIKRCSVCGGSLGESDEKEYALFSQPFVSPTHDKFMQCFVYVHCEKCFKVVNAAIERAQKRCAKRVAEAKKD